MTRAIYFVYIKWCCSEWVHIIFYQARTIWFCFVLVWSLAVTFSALWFMWFIAPSRARGSVICSAWHNTGVIALSPARVCAFCPPFRGRIFCIAPSLELSWLLEVGFIALSLILGEGVGNSIGHNMWFMWFIAPSRAREGVICSAWYNTGGIALSPARVCAFCRYFEVR